MNKDIWALYIGYLIISMNEIDGMTSTCRKKILKKEVNNTWLSKTLSDKLKYLCKKLTADDSDIQKLKALFNEALDLCSTRNFAAHGQFVLDSSHILEEGEEIKFLLHSHKENKPASQKEVEQATRRCIELSNEISKYIAIIEMEIFRTHTV